MRRASVLSRVVVAGLIAAGGAATVRGADPPPRRPEVWALVIGIERYRDEAIPRGRGAVRDSQAIARWLRQAAGWGAGHVLELNDAGDPRPGRPEAQVAALRPTRENLAWAASQWLGARVRPGDVVVVWYSGQVAGRAGRAYLLPIDARTIDVENTGWLLDGALDELAARGQNRILYWLDTSLQGRGRPVAPPPVRPGAPADEPPSGAHWLDQLARWPGVSAWLAAEGHPAAEGADGPGPGPFAAALLEALGTPERPRSLTSCLARLRRDGRVTAQGFRARGGIPPELTLWSRAIQPPAQLRPELLLQRGHAGGITAVAVTPDGSQMITASLDTTVRIWRVADRTLLRVLPYHRLGATSLALSPDGRWLASGDNFGRVQVWDLVTQGPRSPPVPQPHAAGIAALAALPGGTRLVSLDREGTALLWDVSGLVLRAQPLLPAGAPASLRIAGAMEEGGVAVALAGSDDKVRLFDASGRPGPTLDGPGGAVTAVDLAADGRRLAVGDETGRVDVWEVGDPQREPSRVVRTQSPEPGEVGVLRLAADRKLAIGVGETLSWVPPDRPGPWSALPGIPGGVGALAFSADGRTLAVATAAEPGSLHAWRWEAEAAGPRPLRLRAEDGAGAGAPEGALALAFGPDGRSLVVGGGDGDIRTWDLPAGDPGPRLPHHRGQVARLGVSADGRFLLQVTPDGIAGVWDLEQGRGTTPVPGWWNAGAFLGRSDTLVLTAHPGLPARDGAPFGPGDVVLVDRASGRPLPARFPRPAGAEAISFGPVAVSADGLRIAAASLEGPGPLVCVWEAPADARQERPCRLVHAIRGHDDSLTTIGFSADGRRLLTAGIDGAAKVWDLANGALDPPLARAEGGMAGEFRMPADGAQDPAITAAQLDPADARRVVTGSRAGRVLLWALGSERPVADLGLMDGAVLAVAFSADGAFLAAAGEDRLLRIWRLDGAAPRPVRLEPTDQHLARVNALAAWPGKRLFVSGSDDTSTRLWNPAEGQLLGIFSAVPVLPGRRGPEPAREPQDQPAPAAEWVVYTPISPTRRFSQFDASHEGERQVKWLLEREVRPLEQFYAPLHVFGLADVLRKGQLPPLVEPGAPPAVALDPPAQPVAVRRDIELTVTLGDADVPDLRLYQNGMPVRVDDDFQAVPGDPRRRRVPVRLRGGSNRFYVLAGRRPAPDGRLAALDGRSQEVEVRFEGPDEPGKLHVVALGISAYQRRALRYADVDAQAIAAFLKQRGLAGGALPGVQVVLKNEEVTAEEVDRVFAEIQAQANPEDTILVFLAGHTGVIQQRVRLGAQDYVQDRFHLLLPGFPFPPNEPLLVAARGAVIQPAGLPGAPGPTIDPATVLPFVALYRNLARIRPLQRLVVVDACQAESILDDSGVQAIRRNMVRESHFARTAYLLAARRGEAAAEAVPLEHGLLTYALLRGLHADGLKTVAAVQDIFAQAPTADLDADRVVTSLELNRYLDLTLPALADLFPALGGRGNPNRGPRPAAPPPHVDQRLRLQAERASFPLVEVP